MMSKVPAFSVVIPTFQGAGRILTPLDGLSNQSFNDFEVIVVIDGSTDGTYALLEARKYPFPLTIVRQSNRGRAGARNAGVAKAMSDTIIFFDDDLFIPEDALEKYSSLLGSDVLVAVGSVHSIAGRSLEFSSYAEYLNNRWDEHSDGAELQLTRRPYFNAANSFVRKSVFHRFDGFDERLRDAEDFDLAVRLFTSGIAIWRYNGFSVGHMIQNSFRQYHRRLTEYRNARDVLRRINPAADQFLPPLPPKASMKSVVYHLLSFPGLIDAIDKGYFLLLPRLLRYRLYDAILFANTNR